MRYRGGLVVRTCALPISCGRGGPPLLRQQHCGSGPNEGRTRQQAFLHCAPCRFALVRASPTFFSSAFFSSDFLSSLLFSSDFFSSDFLSSLLDSSAFSPSSAFLPSAVL